MTADKKVLDCELRHVEAALRRKADLLRRATDQYVRLVRKQADLRAALRKLGG